MANIPSSCRACMYPELETILVAVEGEKIIGSLHCPYCSSGCGLDKNGRDLEK